MRAAGKPFLKAFTCLIRNNLTSILKTSRHDVEQNKEIKFAVTSSMYLYFNRSWTTTANHCTHSIYIIV